MIKTRFAPSPTGYIHLGNIRTALFSWLFARKHKGQFIIRIDDTDDDRNNNIYINNILYITKWLGIESDEKIFFQSKNFSIYKKILEQLIKENKAYKCFCTKERLEKLKLEQTSQKINPKYDGACKNLNIDKNLNFVIRFNNPKSGHVEFNDSVKGHIKISNTEIDDFIIAKNHFLPTYNFASVVDDINCNITHIIRGDDHISNTPKQINLMTALGYKLPNFSHLPMILDEDKKVLSKRDMTSRMTYYKDEGFLPIAVLNYIVRLGWAHKNKEIFSLDEMKNLFDLKSVSKSPSITNINKLIWLNKHYMKTLTTHDLLKHFLPLEKAFSLNYRLGPTIKQLIDFNKTRSNTLKAIITTNIFLYTDIINLDNTIIKTHFTTIIITTLKYIYEKIKNLSYEWILENIKKLILDAININDITFDMLAHALRLLITGTKHPNSLYEIIFLSGRILILRKIKNIINITEGAVAQIG